MRDKRNVDGEHGIGEGMFRVIMKEKVKRVERAVKERERELGGEK